MLYPLPFDEGRPDETAAPPIDPDYRLAAEVYARLLVDDLTRSARIGVQAQAGVVLLRGRVRAEEVRAAAGRVAAEGGARDVLNDIEVRRGRGLRWPNLVVLFVVGAYASLVAGILGVNAGWIALALICALAAQLLQNRYRDAARRARDQRPG
jgi:hypothetical protein